VKGSSLRKLVALNNQASHHITFKGGTQYGRISGFANIYRRFYIRHAAFKRRPNGSVFYAFDGGMENKGLLPSR
jgi:hypothetical protein